MAIAQMTKIIIVTHRSEARELIEALQHEGITQILDAERAMVSKDFPELQVETKRPRDIEDMVARLEKAIVFLKKNATEKDQTSIFSPLVVIDKARYSEVISGKDALDLLEQTEKATDNIDRLNTEYENKQGTYEALLPWKSLDIPVEELKELTTSTCLVGIIPHQYYDEAVSNLSELEAVMQQVGLSENMHACLVVSRNEAVGDVQKILRSTDFETMSFEGMSGSVGQLLTDCEEQLAQIGIELGDATKKAAELAKGRLALQILFDHYQNLLTREQTRKNAPATEHTILLEGWVKTKQYKKLEEIVAKFTASSVGEIDIAEGEEPPVEIENGKITQPFEVVTRLYGMPSIADVDPTVFLAPFFALFFGLCLTDAGYGLIMVAIFAYIAKKMQGDKKIMLMFVTCSVLTVIAGAATGGWFGNAIQEFVPGLNRLRLTMLWFDPLEKPMTFFALSLGVGYLQIMVGIMIAFGVNLRKKDYTAAVCDQLTWLVMLNSIAIFGASKFGAVDPTLGAIFGKIAIVPAIAIALFSERQGSMGGRLGMGAYQLFSTIFFLGDVLSYLRLMALGMVTAGLGMAFNTIAKMAGELPYIGWLLGALVFVAGHSFNLILSTLSAFVHTLRLQYVEFFPKFLAGGGREFEPLSQSFKHVYIEER